MHCHLRGAQVHGAHQASSHIPALYLPSCSRYSFTDPERMEGWVSPGPGCKEQLAHGCYATACGRRWGSNPWPHGRWSSTLATRLSRHPKGWTSLKMAVYRYMMGSDLTSVMFQLFCAFGIHEARGLVCYTEQYMLLVAGTIRHISTTWRSMTSHLELGRRSHRCRNHSAVRRPSVTVATCMFSAAKQLPRL